MIIILRKLVFYLFVSILIGFNTLMFGQVDSIIQRYRNDNYGNKVNLRQGTFSGNLIRSIFKNSGQIGQNNYSSLTPVSLEWPISSLHSYIGGYTFLIASEITAPGTGQIIHPVQTAYHEFVDSDPSNSSETWIFHPISGYSNPNSDKPAINTDSTTWPSYWPAALNLDSSYNGHWYGYFGKDNFYPTFESFSALDDSKDKEWCKAPYNYFPVLNDTNRAGLGLRLETRVMQWDKELIEDIVFINYDITNLSDFDYPTTCFGLFSQPAIGGYFDLGDDMVSMSTELNLVYFFDSDGISHSPPPYWTPGYLGYTILDSPTFEQNQDINTVNVYPLTGSSINKLKDDEGIWIKLSNNEFNTSIQSSNLIIVAGCGPFSYPKWSTRKLVTALMCEENLENLMQNKIAAKIVYDSKYVIPDSISNIDHDPFKSNNTFNLMQNYPNPFNPSTKISYTLPRTSMVKIKIFDILGNHIQTLLDEQQTKGDYSVEFNAIGLSSGVYFYSIITDNYEQTKKMVLIK